MSSNIQKPKGKPFLESTIDYNYLDKLSPEDKEWLRTFTDEYYGNYFRKGRDRVHPLLEGVTKTGEATDDYWKWETGNSSNLRRSDCLNLTWKNDGEAIFNEEVQFDGFEDAMIAYLDNPEIVEAKIDEAKAETARREALAAPAAVKPATTVLRKTKVQPDV